MWPTRAPGTTLSMPSRMPLPARRMETNTSFLPSMTLDGGLLQRRFDLDVLHRHVARDLVGHQHAELVEQAAEAVGAGLLVAHQESLCCTRGWSMTWTLSRRPCTVASFLCVLERRFRRSATCRAVGEFSRCDAIAAPVRGRRPRCRLRARRPAASASSRCSSSRTSGASSSSSATVSARHSTMSSSPGLPDCARPGPGRAAQHAGVQQQAAVAVLGQAGQLVEAAHLDAGPFEGLQQRVGQPLRQLVEGHPAVARAAPRTGFVAPAVAQRHAAGWFAGRPDARQAISRICDRMSCAATSAVFGTGRRREITSKMPGRPPVWPKTSGWSSITSPRRRSSAARPSRPISGLFSRPGRRRPGGR
jgi:hypothetical protein